MLSQLIKENVDILSIAETKIDETFSENEFLLNSFKKPFRLDKSTNRGGLMVFVRSDISSRRLSDLRYL